MVDVEHGALRAFEQDGLAVADGPIEEPGGVADHRADALSETFVALANSGKVDLGVDSQRFRDGELLFHHGVVLDAE